MLDMSGCNQPTIMDAAFVHIEGIHMLNMYYCDQPTITDAAFVHLKGTHTLDVSQCNQPTIFFGDSLGIPNCTQRAGTVCVGEA